MTNLSIRTMAKRKRAAATNIVQIKDYLPRPPQRQKSLYELYPLPFFNAEKRSTWDVAPTGDYVADCKTGRVYAVEFLRSCDGSVGWSTLLANIVADMIRAGPSGTFPGGHLRVSGLVIGFMTTIGEATCEYVQLAE
jgi:hypothetical protein